MVNPNATCVDPTDEGWRASWLMSPMIEKLNCDSENPNRDDICDGFTHPGTGTTYPFIDYIGNAIFDYGCNCYPENKRYVHPVSGHNLFYPGVNGQPVDDVDGHCKTLAQRYKCLLQDFGPEGTFPTHRLCDYSTAYHYHYNSELNEIVCGKSSDVGMKRQIRNTRNTGVKNFRRCQMALCAMDKEFAENVSPSLMNPRKFWLQEGLRNQNKGISGTDKCRLENREGTQNKCCGGMSPFERRPYNENFQVCCNNQVYGIDMAIDVC
jgi:hypothetical protein